ncbi:MAG TPA: hypothetical protein VHM20_06815, partial [Gammaproteobacteria bacterium]|nr:hypothetical protein [Gammaproteobacteria bacterium]
MPGIEDIKIVLSQPTTVDNVEIDTLYIFLKEHKERPFHFIIDNDLPPKKIGKGDEAYYPGLGKKEKGFILHKNKLYFMDNAASENAQNELEISPMEFERLEKEVNLLEQRHLSYEDVKTICRYARFSSDSIKPSLTTQSSIKIVYRLDSNTKPIEKFLNWDEIKTVERQALEKALREQTSISAELEFAIKKAFIDNTKQEEKKDLDAKAQLSEDFR